MREFKIGYYQADQQNGVSFIGDILEDENQEILPAALFAECLDDLGEEEIIVSFFDVTTFSILENIEKVYGIH